MDDPGKGTDVEDSSGKPEQRYRLLLRGEPLPPGEPRRYRKGEGYVQLRWKIGKGRYVWCYEHRLKHGLPSGLQVHHKNRRRDDNDENNLVPLTPAEHGAEHRITDRKEVLRLYRTGASTVAVAKELGSYPGNIWRMLVAMGEPIRPAGMMRRKPVDEVEVLRLYQSGLGGSAVAERMGVGVAIVWRVLRSHPQVIRRQARSCE